MAEFAPALEYVLDFEDKSRSYAIVPDPGGFAIAGVNSRSWPRNYESIAALPQSQRGPTVASFYAVNFWDVMQLGGLDSQDLANRVMDEGVNAGEYTACRMLQRAANGLAAVSRTGATLDVDGILGPVSTAAINALDQQKLLDAYRQLRLDRYKEIAIEIPSRAADLPVWEKRALA